MAEFVVRFGTVGTASVVVNAETTEEALTKFKAGEFEKGSYEVGESEVVDGPCRGNVCSGSFYMHEPEAEKL